MNDVTWRKQLKYRLGIVRFERGQIGVVVNGFSYHIFNIINTVSATQIKIVKIISPAIQFQYLVSICLSTL